jgi:hypothetical protein
MNTSNAIKVIICLTVCVVSMAFAEDFKTLNGTEYKNATISRVEPDGIVLITKVGVSKVYFPELPKEVQERFHYDSAQAAQFNAAERAAIAQFNAKAQREAEAKEKAMAEQRTKAAKAQQEQAQQAARQEVQRENAAVNRRPVVSSLQRIGGV